MMNSSFMDKQIMDPSHSQSNKNDFIDLMNTPDDHIGGGGGDGDGGSKKDEVLASYDFQPIRPIGGYLPPFYNDCTNTGGNRTWNSTESKINATSLRSYGSLDSTNVILEKNPKVSEADFLSEIDQTMKNHVDSLLHALVDVSARISQLENRTRHLEHAVDDLKLSVGNNHGSTDGKMRQVEVILREIQTGVRVITDKQEIMEGLLQLAKLKATEVEPPAEKQNDVHAHSVMQAASAPPQSHLQPTPGAFTQPPTALPPPNAPPPAQLNLPQLPNQSPAVPHGEPFFVPLGQVKESPNQQYQIHEMQQLQPPPPPPPPQLQQYQTPPLQYSQSFPSPEFLSLSALNLAQPPPPLGRTPEETAFMPSQNHPPTIHQLPSFPPIRAPPTREFYGTSSQAYEPTPSKLSTVFPGAYVPPYGPAESYPYGGSASQYSSGSPLKPQQLSSPATGHSGGSGYPPQLPTARILPHALPTASGVGGSSSSGSGNKVPIDDVVDKVTSMGFSRDQVRAAVGKLTEDGQSVDLNVVLDKLMNDGEGQQPPRGWYGR